MALKSKGSRVRCIDLTGIRRYIKKKHPDLSLGLSTNNGVVTVQIDHISVAIPADGLTQRQLEKEVESWIPQGKKLSGITSTRI